jgi:hypothetical protein
VAICGTPEIGDPRLHAVDDRSRAIDLAQRPQRDRQIGHCANAGVHPEAIREIVVAAGLEKGERSFQVISRLRVLAGVPAVHSSGAIGDAASGESGFASMAPTAGSNFPSRARESVLSERCVAAARVQALGAAGRAQAVEEEAGAAGQFILWTNPV